MEQGGSTKGLSFPFHESDSYVSRVQIIAVLQFLCLPHLALFVALPNIDMDRYFERICANQFTDSVNHLTSSQRMIVCFLFRRNRSPLEKIIVCQRSLRTVAIMAASTKASKGKKTKINQKLARAITTVTLPSNASMKLKPVITSAIFLTLDPKVAWYCPSLLRSFARILSITISLG